MTEEIKRNCHTDTSGPPAGSMPVVKTNREETSTTSLKTANDDDGNQIPSGGLQSDGSHPKYGRKCLKIGTWNVRTLYKQGNLDNLVKEASELDTDILGISETRWIDDGVIKKNGFELHHAFREGKRGGGSAILYKSHLTIKEGEASATEYSSFE